MAALSDTQLPVHFNGWYCRVCTTIVSPLYSSSFTEFHRAEGSRKLPFPSFVPFRWPLSSVLYRNPDVWQRCEEKNQTAVRWYGGMEGLTLVKLIGLFFRREMTRRKKVKRSWSNPTKPIVNDRRVLPTCFHHGIVRSKFSSKLGITRQKNREIKIII